MQELIDIFNFFIVYQFLDMPMFTIIFIIIVPIYRGFSKANKYKKAKWDKLTEEERKKLKKFDFGEMLVTIVIGYIILFVLSGLKGCAETIIDIGRIG